jgi:hypothetical protein
MSKPTIEYVRFSHALEDAREDAEASNRQRPNAEPGPEVEGTA